MMHENTDAVFSYRENFKMINDDELKFYILSLLGLVLMFNVSLLQ